MTINTAHATPGGQIAAPYQVIESQLHASADHVDQVAVVGRSNDGIHILLTEPAAEVLAKLLIRATSEPEDVEHLDNDLWAHVAIDLLANRALAMNASTLQQDVVYAMNVPGRSGYLQPGRRRLGLAPTPEVTDGEH